MKTIFLTNLAVLALIFSPLAVAEPVGITPEMFSVDVVHKGKTVKIQRHQDNENTIIADYALTSRPCPRFCIRPMKLAPGVETIGELEMLDYLVEAGKPGSKVLVIDSRTPDWVAKGTIPGSVNIPWTLLKEDTSDPLTIAGILEERFGARDEDGLWNYSEVKTVVLYCNGMWCGQSPRNIMTLLKYGYPADKIKWYRGGMQNWTALGLTTVK
ncbi:MAG: rhodanese-like domain-containing protein [Xanthomonadales bacterium]|nr:rhodanese-like domain-containing protein [Gammaproteobacteria bacterium]NNK04827.1 rhodanese-like domain-containing protein [Xanthomonadales bacterium]